MFKKSEFVMRHITVKCRTRRVGVDYTNLVIDLSTASALQANPNSALESKVFGLKSFLTVVLATLDVHHIGTRLSCN